MTQSDATSLQVEWDVFDRLVTERGWTTNQEQAERLGISPGHLSNMRAGRDGPGSKFIHSCLTVWGTSMYTVLFKQRSKDAA